MPSWQVGTGSVYVHLSGILESDSIYIFECSAYVRMCMCVHFVSVYVCAFCKCVCVCIL